MIILNRSKPLKISINKKIVTLHSNYTIINKNKLKGYNRAKEYYNSSHSK